MTTQKTDLHCPISKTVIKCIYEKCALYNDDARACVLSPCSLHLLIRTAITDAAVEISRCMGDGRRV